MKIISIKDLRQNLSQVADDIQSGEVFQVFRRSKPAFKIVPVDMVSNEEWETVIDFTQNGQKDGEKIEDVLSVLKTMNG